MLTNNVLCLHIDKSGRLWVGTEGGGIYLYNRQNDRFEEKIRNIIFPEIWSEVSKKIKWKFVVGDECRLGKTGCSNEK